MRPNIFCFIPDDVGREYVPQYGILPANVAVEMPWFSRLCSSGVRFTRAYSQPWCSPTRASMLTGRRGHQTGIGSLAEAANQPLLEREVCLPYAVKLATDNAYRTAAFGKWHLSSYTTRGGEYEHPIRCGFDHFEGHLRNIEYESYYSWQGFRAKPSRTGIDVEQLNIDEYSPMWLANRAIDWITEVGDTPWFIWFAINLPHTPYARPPSGMYDADKYVMDTLFPSSSGSAQSPTYFKAMLQAMDNVGQHIFDSIPQRIRNNTTWIWWSDNGTQSDSMDTLGGSGLDLTSYLGSGYTAKVKRTVYELGIRVPMCVSGARVGSPGRVSSSLVAPTDLFETVIDLVDGSTILVPLPDGGTRDSTSFFADITGTGVTTRTLVQPDLFGPNEPHINCTVTGDRALVYANYKLMKKNSTGVTGFPSSGTPAPVSGIEFYKIDTDPNETNNLIATGYNALAGADKTAYDFAVANYAVAWSTL